MMNESVCILRGANTFEKVMNPTIQFLAMGN